MFATTRFLTRRSLLHLRPRSAPRITSLAASGQNRTLSDVSKDTMKHLFSPLSTSASSTSVLRSCASDPSRDILKCAASGKKRTPADVIKKDAARSLSTSASASFATFDASTSVFRSPHSALDLPSSTSLSRVLSACASDPSREIFECAVSGKKRTLADVSKDTHGFAAGLRALGVGAVEGEEQRDAVAVVMPNDVDYPAVCYGAAMAGAIVSPVNPVYTPDELARQFHMSETKAVFTVSALLGKTVDAARECGGVSFVFVVDAEAGDYFSSPEGVTVLPARDLMNIGEGVDVTERSTAIDEIFLVPFSSGTTGLPKGVYLTHRNVSANISQVLAVEKYDKDADVFLGILPLFHIYGFVVILGVAMMSKVKTVFMPQFDLPLYLKTIQDKGVTFLHLAPPVAVALAKHPMVDQFDLSSVHTVFSGAAPLSEDTEREVVERLKKNREIHGRAGDESLRPIEVRQAYGMTELSPASHISPPGKGRTGMVGPLVPNCEALIIDIDSGERLGPNQRGSLLVSGPNVMRGYTCEEANAETLVTEFDLSGNSGDPKVWLKTGDVAEADTDGYFRIVDRTKELIKVSGFQVAPAELEALILTHPKVADAGVVPYPDEAKGEVPYAFVHLKPGQEATEDEIIDFVADKVAHFKRVRFVRFVEAVPKSAAGKILRKDMRAILQKEIDQSI